MLAVVLRQGIPLTETEMEQARTAVGRANAASQQF